MDVTEAAKLYFFEFFWFSCTEFTDYSHHKLVKFSCFLLRVFFCVKTENTIRTWRRNFQNFPQSVDKKISLLSTFFGLGQPSTVAMGAARRKNIPEYFILGHKNPSQLSQNWGGRNSPTQKTELVPTPPVFLAVYNRYRRNKERFICPPDLGSFGAHVRGGAEYIKKESCCSSAGSSRSSYILLRHQSFNCLPHSCINSSTLQIINCHIYVPCSISGVA